MAGHRGHLRRSGHQPQMDAAVAGSERRDQAAQPEGAEHRRVAGQRSCVPKTIYVGASRCMGLKPAPVSQLVCDMTAAFTKKPQQSRCAGPPDSVSAVPGDRARTHEHHSTLHVRTAHDCRCCISTGVMFLICCPARRTADGSPEAAWQALLGADAPKDIAQGKAPGVAHLQQCRDAVNAEIGRCARMPPKFSSDGAA